MTDDQESIDSLLAHYRELRDQGYRVSLEDLCRGNLEKLAELRRAEKGIEELCAFLGIDQDGCGASKALATNYPLPLLPGYEILGELGHGGMGVVYKSRQVSLNRFVALKMMHPRHGLGPDRAHRLRKEAQAIASLDHPNIVKVFEVGEQEGQPYVAFELVDGGNLQSTLGGSPKSPIEAAGLTEKLALAVAYAHEHGIIHRDLKPANILLTAGGIPKIADFGLAKQTEDVERATQSGLIVGTLSYMAPEQVKKATSVDCRVDIYSLGVILYQLLTGRVPFIGQVHELVRQIESDAPVLPRQSGQVIPVDLQVITLKCLEKNPAKRYQTALELASDLRRFLNREPILARPLGHLTRTYRWCRRNPVATSAIVLLVMLALSTGFSRMLIARKEQAAEAARLQAVKDSERADRNFEWTRRISVNIMETLLQHPHFRTAPEFRDLHETLLTFATALFEDLASQKRDNPLLEADLGRICWLLAATRMFKNEKRQALPNIEQMQAIFGRLTVSSPDERIYQFLYGWSFGLQASVFKDLGQPDEAERADDQAIAILSDLANKSPDFARGIAKLAICYEQRACLLGDRGKTDEAFLWLDKAYRLLKEMPPTKEPDAISDQRFYIRKTCEDKVRIAADVKRWPAVAKALSQTIELDRDRSDRWNELAAATLASGGPDACRRVCHDMILRFQSSPKVEHADRIAYACVVLPNTVPDSRTLVRFAERASTIWNGNTRILGAASYRAGDFGRAVECFDKAKKATALRAWDYFFMSMAYAKLKRLDKARQLCQQGNAWLEEAKHGKHGWGWTEQIESDSLCREAQAVLAEYSKPDRR